VGNLNGNDEGGVARTDERIITKCPNGHPQNKTTAQKIKNTVGMASGTYPVTGGASELVKRFIVEKL